jgi:hypothetical protein
VGVALWAPPPPPQTLMQRKGHTPEEVIKKLRRADEELAGSKGIEDVCRRLDISQATHDC